MSNTIRKQLFEWFLTFEYDPMGNLPLCGTLKNNKRTLKNGPKYAKNLEMTLNFFTKRCWQSCIIMFLKAVKGGRLNSRTPNMSAELSINLVDSLSLNFLDCRAEMCIHLYEEFLCQYKFQLSLLFSRQNIKSLKQSLGDLCVLILFLILTLKLCSTWSY